MVRFVCLMAIDGQVSGESSIAKLAVGVRRRYPPPANILLSVSWKNNFNPVHRSVLIFLRPGLNAFDDEPETIIKIRIFILILIHIATFYFKFYQRIEGDDNCVLDDAKC